MIDPFITQVLAAQSEGATILIKWDGERQQGKCTVMVSRGDTDYVWRRDTDDISAALAEALAHYRAAH